jgi:hypothetical protein
MTCAANRHLGKPPTRGRVGWFAAHTLPKRRPQIMPIYWQTKTCLSDPSSSFSAKWTWSWNSSSEVDVNISGGLVLDPPVKNFSPTRKAMPTSVMGYLLGIPCQQIVVAPFFF